MTLSKLLKDPALMDRAELLAEIARLNEALEVTRAITTAAIDWSTASTIDRARVAAQQLSQAVGGFVAASIRDLIAIGDAWEAEELNQALAEEPTLSWLSRPRWLPGDRP